MLELIAGQKYVVAFIIDNTATLVECLFTGEYVQVNGEDLFILTNKSSGKEYGMTKKQLDDFAGINLPDARQSVDSITVG